MSVLPFEAPALLVPNPLVNPTCTVNQDSPNMLVWMDFPQNMDQTVIPLHSDFRYTDMSSNVLGSARTWLSATRFQITFNGGDTFDPPATCTQIVGTTKFKTLAGMEYPQLPAITVTGR